MNDTGFDDVADTARAWARWSWLVVLAAVAGAALALVGNNRLQAADPTATTTLGLNNAVVWPYHETILAEHVGYLNDPQFRSSVDGVAAGATVQVSPGVSTIKIRVEASTEDEAVMTANALAAAAVAKGEVAARAADQAKIPPLQDALAASQKRADALQAELTAQRARYNALAPSSARDDVGTQVERLIRDLNAELDVSNVVRAEISQATRALGAPLPGMSVVEPARPVGATSSRATVAVLGAAVLALLALLLTPLLERRFGRVRRTTHVELGDTATRWIVPGPSDGPLPARSPRDLILAALGADDHPLAVLAVADPADARAVASLATSAGVRPVVDGGSVDSPEATSAAVRAGRVLLLARRGRTPRRQLAATLRRLASLDVEVESIVLLEPDSPLLTSG